MPNKKQTSPKVAKKAARELPNPKTPTKFRAPIASALAQAPGKKGSPKKKG